MEKLSIWPIFRKPTYRNLPSVKRRQKVGFSGPVKLQNHTNELREKERRKIMRKEKDRRKREESNECTPKFNIGYFGEKKNVAPKRSI